MILSSLGSPQERLDWRKRQFMQRVVTCATEFIHAAYGEALPHEEMHERFALACEGAARELARDGELKDLEIDRPDQIAKVKVAYVVAPSPPDPSLGVGVGASHAVTFDFTGTVLEHLGPWRWLQPTFEDRADWLRYLTTLPAAVLAVVDRFEPWNMYRRRSTGQRCAVLGVSTTPTRVRVYAEDPQHGSLSGDWLDDVDPADLVPWDGAIHPPEGSAEASQPEVEKMDATARQEVPPAHDLS